MLALAAWICAGVALWLSRSVLDVFDAAGRTTRVAAFPSAPELIGLIVLSLLVGAAVQLFVRRWTRQHASPVERRHAFLQISLPLFGLTLVAVPYLPWLPDEIDPFRALAGPVVKIIWFVVVGEAVLTFLAVRASYRRTSSATGLHIFGTIMVALVTAAFSWAGVAQLRETLTALALASEPALSSSPLVVWIIVGLNAVTAALMWRWVLAFTGSTGASTFAWAVVFLSAPLLFTSVSLYADAPAAFCVMLALAWRTKPGTAQTNWGEYLVRGLAVSILPWLSTAYAPMAAALVILLGLRAAQDRRAVLALLVPFTVSLVRWFAFYRPQQFGSPLTGVLGLVFDQEFGILIYAPAMALGFVGLWQMLTAGGKRGRVPFSQYSEEKGTRPLFTPTNEVRQRGRELGLVFGVLLASVGSLATWWGGAAPPGRPLVPVLPLLGLPIAWAYLGTPEGSVRRSVCQLLAFIGIATTLAMLMTEQGALVIQDRDGSARVLQWLTVLWPAWQIAPAVAAQGLRQSAALIALWIAAGVAVAWIGRHNSLRQPGASSLLAMMNVGAAALIVALVAPALAHTEPPSVTAPEARSRLPMLDNFDSRARPHAVIYRPFTLARAADIPPLMALAAKPGLRTGGQPVRVFLNARYALAAGEYTVEIGGLHATGPVIGSIGLQVGRIGAPLREWPVELAPDATWRTTFTLPVDAEFVGFVVSESLSSATSLRIAPLTIVDRSNRALHGPSRIVLSAVGFSSASIFFYDEDVYPEHNGFWVHGESTLYMAVASDHPEQGVTLRVHSGAASNRVTFATTTWGEQLNLTPGVAREVHIPPPARPGPFLLRVTTERGFVPAEVVPGNTDRRILGCWIEVASQE